MTTGASASFRDPENAAVAFEGTWYRVAAPESAAALRALRASDAYTRLTDAGSLVRFEPSDEATSAQVLAHYSATSGRTAPQGAQVFAVESVDLITYPWEWPNSMLQDAGRLTLAIRDELLGIGLDLKDASAMNIAFRGMRPVLIDIGSVEAWRPNPSWNAARQFIEHFINPLAVGSGDRVTAADAWQLGAHRGLRSETARELMPKRQRRRMSLWLLQASTRPVASNKPSETRFGKEAASNPDLALNATRGLGKRLRKQIDALTAKDHATTWQDYGSRAHYGSDDLDRKAGFARAFVQGREALVLDVGGNDGFTGADLVRQAGARVIVMDADAGALDVLHRGLSGSSDLATRMTPLLGDLTNLTPGSGLLDTEFASFVSRVRPTAVTCQAVLHHVVITQGVPMPLAVEALARFGAPVQIEFADENDEKVRILLSQIPNWAGDYTTEALLAAMRTRFDHVEVAGTTSPTRVVVNGWNDPA